MKPKKYFLTLLKRFLLLRSLGVFFALVIFVFMAVFPRTTLAWNPYESYLSWFDDYRNYISDSAAKIPENISRPTKKNNPPRQSPSFCPAAIVGQLPPPPYKGGGRGGAPISIQPPLSPLSGG